MFVFFSTVLTLTSESGDVVECFMVSFREVGHTSKIVGTRCTCLSRILSICLSFLLGKFHKNRWIKREKSEHRNWILLVQLLKRGTDGFVHGEIKLQSMDTFKRKHVLEIPNLQRADSFRDFSKTPLQHLPQLVVRDLKVCTNI